MCAIVTAIVRNWIWAQRRERGNFWQYFSHRWCKQIRYVLSQRMWQNTALSGDSTRDRTCMSGRYFRFVWVVYMLCRHMQSALNRKFYSQKRSQRAIKIFKGGGADVLFCSLQYFRISRMNLTRTINVVSNFLADGFITPYCEFRPCFYMPSSKGKELWENGRHSPNQKKFAMFDAPWRLSYFTQELRNCLKYVKEPSQHSCGRSFSYR